MFNQKQFLIGFNAALFELGWVGCPNWAKPPFDSVSSTVILVWLRLKQRPFDIFLVIGLESKFVRENGKNSMQSDHAVSMHDFRHPWLAVFLNRTFSEWADS